MSKVRAHFAVWRISDGYDLVRPRRLNFMIEDVPNRDEVDRKLGNELHLAALAVCVCGGDWRKVE